MKLCLLVSRRCDLRCGFCHVEFTGKDMGWATAREAMDGYLEWLPRGHAPVVKFFGGEPLLNFKLVRRMVEEAPSLWPRARLSFELPTNGVTLDKAKREWLAAHPEVEVTVSQRPEAAQGLPEAWFTLVLDRQVEPRAALASMKELLSAGYRRFNVLPAYYVPWTPAELRSLKASLHALAVLLRGLKRLDPGVRVRNAEVQGSVPLYNDALTVDVDGQIYASNMVQCHGMEPHRAALRLGHVRGPRPWRMRRAPPKLLQDTMQAWAGPQAWKATRQVDRLLSEFVWRLS